MLAIDIINSVTSLTDKGNRDLRFSYKLTPCCNQSSRLLLAVRKNCALASLFSDLAGMLIVKHITVLLFIEFIHLLNS